jgi:thiol:disulfide interchange protein
MPPEGADLTLWAALAFALAGGLILNLMPCVLPVLFIKALGFAQVAHRSRSAVREQGLLFLGGVLVDLPGAGRRGDRAGQRSAPASAGASSCSRRRW